MAHVRGWVDDEVTRYQSGDLSREELVNRIVRVVRFITTEPKPGSRLHDLFRPNGRATRSPPFDALPRVFASLGGRVLAFVGVWYLDSV